MVQTKESGKPRGQVHYFHKSYYLQKCRMGKNTLTAIILQKSFCSLLKQAVTLFKKSGFVLSSKIYQKTFFSTHPSCCELFIQYIFFFPEIFSVQRHSVNGTVFFLQCKEAVNFLLPLTVRIKHNIGNNNKNTDI